MKCDTFRLHTFIYSYLCLNPPTMVQPQDGLPKANKFSLFPLAINITKAMSVKVLWAKNKTFCSPHFKDRHNKKTSNLLTSTTTHSDPQAVGRSTSHRLTQPFHPPASKHLPGLTTCHHHTRVPCAILFKAHHARYFPKRKCCCVQLTAPQSRVSSLFAPTHHNNKQHLPAPPLTSILHPSCPNSSSRASLTRVIPAFTLALSI